MLYREFKEEIVGRLTKEFPDREIELRPILKNNGLSLDGLTIMEEGINISPTIYLNYYYDLEEKGTDLDEIYKSILSTYERSRLKESIDPACFKDFETARSRIVYDVVSRERNEDLLKEVPFLPYLDLAIVFRILLKADQDTYSSVLIHKAHMAIWEKDVDDLMEEARVNTPRLLPARIRSLTEVLSSVLGDEVESLPPVEERVPIYVLTNLTGMHGAGCLLYDRVLSDLSAKAGSDLSIIPSSIHEVLLFPQSRDIVPAPGPGLDELIVNVNRTEVPLEEILSDHAYTYSRKTREVSF